MEKDRLFSEGMFHIFQCMLAGLSESELSELGVSGYAGQGNSDDRDSYRAWAGSLSQLGISLADILRVLAGVLVLLSLEYARPGGECVASLARLLGVSQACLVHTLWRHSTHRGWEGARRGLAASLYTRTVHIILRRINSHHVCDQQAAPASFIGILDMCGWQGSMQGACSMEQLCMNTCSEAMQELYCDSVGIDTAPTMGSDELLASIEKICQHSPHSVTIQHHMGPVLYDSTQFIGTAHEYSTHSIHYYFRYKPGHNGCRSHIHIPQV